MRQMHGILSFCLTALLATVAHAGQEPSERVTIKARWRGSGGPLPWCRARQIIAWYKGDVRLSKESGILLLEVRRIVEGQLHDPHFLERPTGVALLEVIPLDSAAAGVDASRQGVVASGLWRLTRLPDGSYVVSDLQDTPFASPGSTAELDAVARMTADLASRDPQVKYNGLRLLRERCCPALFPQVLEMLGSDAPITADGPNGTNMLVKSTLGREAAKALYRGSWRFRDWGAPTDKSTPAAWKAWWEGLLRTQPFSPVVPDTVRCRDIIALRINQPWPEASVSPDGRHAVVTAPLLERPLDGMKGGICLLDLEADSRPEWFYRVPPARAVRKRPHSVRVAWGKDAICVIFREFDHDEPGSRLTFLTVDYRGQILVKPHKIPLKDTRSFALAACQSGWLLAYVSRGGAAFVVRLDGDGAILREPVQLARKRPDGSSHPHDRIHTISVTTTNSGSALALGGDRTLFLSLLDRELNLRSTVRVDDPSLRNWSRADPRIAWDGQRLLVSWIQYSGSTTNKLYLRLFDGSGRPQGQPTEVAEGATAIAPPVPLGDGYALAWVDHSTRPNLVRVVRIGSEGKLGPITAVHGGITPTHPIGLGAAGDTAHVLVHDRSTYPRHFLLKSQILGSGRGRTGGPNREHKVPR